MLQNLNLLLLFCIGFAVYRVEGDGLALGVFTQDLAQDLDQEATAVEVVTRKVRQVDSQSIL